MQLLIVNHEMNQVYYCPFFVLCYVLSFEVC